MKKTSKFIYMLCFLLIGVVESYAQAVTGIVTDKSGTTIPGVNVLIKGTTRGTTTDLDGKFSLEVSGNNAVLIFSSLGMVTQEIPVGTRTEFNIVLEDEANQLEEVVVTALGIKREKRALGYAMQELKSDEILQARELNLANSLSGKVSGLQVIRSSNGPGASSKIVLRGNNSVTGLNQPLIVVDGVPMDNFTGASNNDFWNPSADMGNGISDINPEDIQSMSVLKGASAAALYGSRAGNGVILITTKSGKRNEGLGITVSSSLSLESLFMTPDKQMSFGQGSLGVFAPQGTTSWGPKIDGTVYEKWNGVEAPIQAFDNLNNYFDSYGVNFAKSISFSQQYENTTIYTSVNHVSDQSIIPNAELKRTNLMARAISKFGKNNRWTTDTKVQYIKAKAKNRPISGNNASNPYMTMYTLPVSLDIRDFSNAVDDRGKMLWFGGGSQINPYWLHKYNINQDERDRFVMFGSLRYDFTDWLNAEIKGGTDMYFTETGNRTYAGSPLTNTGRYGLGQDKFYENNFSFLVSAQKDNLIDRFGGALSFGGNLMDQRNIGLSASVDELQVPDIFSLGNAKNKVNTSESFSRKKINSLYGTAQVNYDGFLFVDGTFRNDWSSTLSKKRRSFFYPSISTSWVISDMINKHFGQMPGFFTYAKVRGSFAQVGNDMGAFQLYNTYWIGKDPEDHTTAGSNGTLYDPEVRSELISSWEFGTELRFFNNRLGFDFTWYKSNARNQLLNLSMDPMSGYNSKKINAGDIQNKGIEFVVNIRPIEMANSFTWDIMVNYSRNENKIIAFTDEIKMYSLGGYDNLRIYATAGGNYGEIFGTTYRRVTDANSPYYGKMIVTEAGLPTGNTELKKIGDQQAKALLGITNSFSYKGFSLNFLIDARFGGSIFSGTNHSMQSAGTAAATVVNGKRDNMVLDAVYLDAQGVYQVNRAEITTQDYWTAVTATTGNLGIGEANLYDATNIRLRNIQLNYSFNKKLLALTPIKQLKVGVASNNLWMIKSHLNGVDPESVFATSTNAVGFENSAPPTTRTFLFNVTIGF